jgi:hypothetical protein
VFAVVVRVVDLCALARGGWEGKKRNQLRDLNPPPDELGGVFFVAEGNQVRIQTARLEWQERLKG